MIGAQSRGHRPGPHPRVPPSWHPDQSLATWHQHWPVYKELALIALIGLITVFMLIGAIWYAQGWTATPLAAITGGILAWLNTNSTHPALTGQPMPFALSPPPAPLPAPSMIPVGLPPPAAMSSAPPPPPPVPVQ